MEDSTPHDAVPDNTLPNDTVPENALRASDADRTAVADRLRAAVDEGRLSALEYDDRLGRAYAATTYGELAPLTQDLPAAPKPPPPPAPAPPRRRGMWLMPIRNWVAGNVFFVAIWAWASIASGHLVFFWPAFFMLLTGAAAVSQMVRQRERPAIDNGCPGPADRHDNPGGEQQPQS
jgi:hypothetical protein